MSIKKLQKIIKYFILLQNIRKNNDLKMWKNFKKIKKIPPKREN